MYQIPSLNVGYFSPKSRSSADFNIANDVCADTFLIHCVKILFTHDATYKCIIVHLSRFISNESLKTSLRCFYSCSAFIYSSATIALFAMQLMQWRLVYP